MATLCDVTSISHYKVTDEWLECSGSIGRGLKHNDGQSCMLHANYIIFRRRIMKISNIFELDISLFDIPTVSHIVRIRIKTVKK